MSLDRPWMLLFALTAGLTASAAMGQSMAFQQSTEAEADARFLRDGRIYVGLSLGATFPNDGDLTSGLEFVGMPSNSIEYDTGYSVGGSIGMFLGWARIEAEVLHRDSDVDDWDVSGFGDLDADGDLRTLAFMANVFYDHEVTDRTDLYVGTGLGAANIDGKLSGGGVEFSGDDWVLAWQLLAGVAYQLREDVAVTGGYRLFVTEDYKFDDADFDAPVTHSLEVGLRYTF